MGAPAPVVPVGCLVVRHASTQHARRGLTQRGVNSSHRQPRRCCSSTNRAPGWSIKMTITAPGPVTLAITSAMSRSSANWTAPASTVNTSVIASRLTPRAYPPAPPPGYGAAQFFTHDVEHMSPLPRWKSAGCRAVRPSPPPIPSRAINVSRTRRSQPAAPLIIRFLISHSGAGVWASSSRVRHRLLTGFRSLLPPG